MTPQDVQNDSAEEKVTKTVYRFKVWNELENKDLVIFPRPCKGRIPNFVDRSLAAAKLTAEEAFKKAEVIMVNLDIPQEPVRFNILEAGKTLVVPMTRLEDGLISKVCLPEDANRYVLKSACKRRGVDEYGKPVSLRDEIHIDMIVLGSVAVSKEGHRIGKGGGHSDLDFAMLAAIGAVTGDTIVATTVHDKQVFDTLPHHLFEPFDVPVDLIVTPTRVIHVGKRLSRPEGILWNAVSNRRFEVVPILKKLRDKEIEGGKECTLKEVDSEPEEVVRPYYRPSFNRRRPQFQRQQRDSQRSRSGSRQNSTARDLSRRTRTFRRQQPVNGTGGAAITNGQRQQRFNKGVKADKNMDTENKENQRRIPVKRRRFIRNKVEFDFSVKVSNIVSSVRVRDLKAALYEKGVRPRDITWKGPKGFAFLHFAKVRPEPEQPTAVDDVIASLQGLTVKFESEKEVKETLLSVEPANRISRIEDAGVTAV